MKRGNASALVVPLVGVVLIIATLVALASSASSNDVTGEKQALVDSIVATHDAAVQQALEHPELLPSKNPDYVWPTWEPQPWEPEIIERSIGIGLGFRVRNMWRGDVNGYHVLVYAGTDYTSDDSPGVGALRVRGMSSDYDFQPQLGGSYRAPIGVGEFRIVSFEGTLLALEAETGESFNFDVDSRAFTDAKGDPVPTDTPTPTPLPSPPLPPVTLPPFPFPGDVPDDATPVPAPSGVAY